MGGEICLKMEYKSPLTIRHERINGVEQPELWICIVFKKVILKFIRLNLIKFLMLIVVKDQRSLQEKDLY